VSNTERLMIFTRYPEAGKTKTRLIPALGAAGAAQLQRQMTEHTIAQLNQCQSRSVQIWFTSGDSVEEIQAQRQLMTVWLGAFDYQPQGSGDLGARLNRAFEAAFAAGMQQVAAIGTDCPELDAGLLEQAFHLLQQHDLVLGPATDGGYYLIGLSRLIPELFEDIDWGTEVVLQQTVTIAEQGSRSIAYLPPLTDVDRPADLGVWQRVQAHRPQISIVIPARNEEKMLKAALVYLSEYPALEVVVVDGGSSDRTVAIAESFGVQVITAQPGRARQMNAGAAAAIGDILLFLHADTRLPDDFVAQIQQVLTTPGTIAGAFRLQIAGDRPGLRWVERGVNWRSRYLQLPYGDQAIFLKAETFRQVGGFLDLPIMEDFELVRRLGRQGKVTIAAAAVLTSGRRWQKLGVLKTTLINQLTIAGYLLGVSPTRLANWYYRLGQGEGLGKSRQKDRD